MREEEKFKVCEHCNSTNTDVTGRWESTIFDSVYIIKCRECGHIVKVTGRGEIKHVIQQGGSNSEEESKTICQVPKKSPVGCGSTAFQIMINLENGETIDAICNSASYGHKDGLLEIMGGLTEEEGDGESVLGYLTAEEVFKRFKYCYENNTTIYKEE